MASLVRGRTRTTSRPRESMRIAEPSASVTSTDSAWANSHERAWNAEGFEVSAPTGQRSITLACNSEVIACSR